MRFTEKEVKAIRNRERLFWVYGFIRYFNQFTNDVWDAGFSATITADNSWVRIDLPNYAYHRRYEPGRENPAAEFLGAHRAPPYLTGLRSNVVEL